MMLATEQVRRRPVAECQRIIDLQGTPTAQHSARAFFISNAKVTVKLPGEVPSQLFSARTVLLADVRLTMQSVVGIVNQAQQENTIQTTAMGIQCLEIPFEELVKTCGAVKSAAHWTVGREGHSRLHGREGTISGENAAADIKRALAVLAPMLYAILVHIMGGQVPPTPDFGLDDLSTATSSLELDANVKALYTNLFYLLTIEAREFKHNPGAGPPAFHTIVSQASTQVISNIYNVEAAERAGRRGASQGGGAGTPSGNGGGGGGGGGSATGSDEEAAKRKAKFDELKAKKKLKQAEKKKAREASGGAATSGATSGGNGSGGGSGGGGSGSGGGGGSNGGGGGGAAAPAAAGGATRLTAMKRSELRPDMLTCFIDKVHGTAGGLIETLDRIMIEEAASTPPHEHLCWWKFAIGECRMAVGPNGCARCAFGKQADGGLMKAIKAACAAKLLDRLKPGSKVKSA